MRILELFSGTGSVGKVFGADGWEVVSLDINKKTNASICADIRTWDYTIFDVGHFDVVWASPVCTHYSRARTTAKTPRDLEWADSLVLKALEIIEYLKPKYWYIENPQTGLLKTRPFMLNLPYTDVEYCRYCDWGYKKRTRIWTNSGYQGRRCLGAGLCASMVGKRHLRTAQRGGRMIDCELEKNSHTEDELYRIPDDLISDLNSISSS